MELVQKVSLVGLRQLLVSAARGEGDAARLVALLTCDPENQTLSVAMGRAQAQAWRAVEILLAGPSFWDGCQVFLPPAECQAFRAKVETLRAQTPLGNPGNGDDLRRRCWQELGRARQAGLLAEGPVNTRALAEILSPGAEPQPPAGRELTDELRRADYPALAELLQAARLGEPSLLAGGLHFFLRRELAGAPDLLHGLGLDRADAMPEIQETALAAIAAVMSAHGRGLREWLADEGEAPCPAPQARPAVRPTAAAQPQAAGAGGPRSPGLGGWLLTAGVLLIPVLLVLWVVNRHSVREERVFTGHVGPVTCLAFAPDGKHIFSGGSDGTARLWDVATGKELRQFGKRKTPVLALAVASDENRVITADKARVQIWDVASGKELPGPALKAGTLPAVRFTADGREVLLLSDGVRLEEWDLRAGKVIRLFTAGADSPQCLTLSPDGRRAAAGGGNAVYLWDLEGKKLLRKFEGHKAPVVSVAFSPTGKRLASGSIDEKVRIWDLSSSRSVRVIDGPHSPVVDLAFAPDGKRLLTGALGTREPSVSAPVTDRQPMRLWEVPSGREVCLFDGPPSGVFSVAFSPDGRQVLSGGTDGVIRLWPLPPVDDASGPQ